MGKVEARERPLVALPSFPPRGLNRFEAARHVGVSPSMFDELVRDGRMPQPKIVNSRVVWDRLKIEAFFDALPERNEEPARDTFADWR